MKRGLETIQIRHQFSHLFGQLILISKLNLVDNNKRINEHFFSFHKIVYGL